MLQLTRFAVRHSIPLELALLLFPGCPRHRGCVLGFPHVGRCRNPISYDHFYG